MAEGGYTFTARIPIEKLEKALEVYGEEIRFVGIPRALNVGGRAGGVKMIRALAKQTGLKQGDVRKLVKTTRATRSNWSFKFTATSTALGLSAFGLRGGVGSGARGRHYQIWAAPWGRRQVFKNAFIVRKKNGTLEAFKRIGQGRSAIKQLWGPVVSSEMIRGGDTAPRPAVAEFINIASDVAEHRLPHELHFAFLQAKQRSGT